MYFKTITMSFEQAEKIANDMLDVFQAIYEIYPLKLSTSIENGRTKNITLSLLPESIKLKISYSPRTKDEFCLDLIYKVIRDNRCFEITLFDDPDDCGYYSMLPDYDPSTYILCKIIEKRPNGSQKYAMTFGIDIQKGTFVELFEVLHYNAVGILREYPNLNSRLEAELKDVIII